MDSLIGFKVFEVNLFLLGTRRDAVFEHMGALLLISGGDEGWTRKGAHIDIVHDVSHAAPEMGYRVGTVGVPTLRVQ